MFKTPFLQGLDLLLILGRTQKYTDTLTNWWMPYILIGAALELFAHQTKAIFILDTGENQICQVSPSRRMCLQGDKNLTSLLEWTKIRQTQIS